MASKPTGRELRFCQALHAETGDRSRWTTIVAVAKRVDLDVGRAILVAAECAAEGYVQLDVKGPPYALLPASARLIERGWKVVMAPVKKPAARHRAGRQGKARAKARTDQSA